MTTHSDKTGVVRHTTKNDLYRHAKGDTYRLIRTGKEFEVPVEKANEVFRLSLDATGLLNAYPEIENLVKALSLRIEK